VLQVRDDGPGIPDDALTDVFTPGWSTKPGTGTGRRGLGLALVSSTAGRHGGVVRAANEGGAVFTVEVPVRSRVAST
jgi:two-component system CitB family sensor kinase